MPDPMVLGLRKLREMDSHSFLVDERCVKLRMAQRDRLLVDLSTNRVAE